MTEEEVRAAAAKMVPALKSSVFYEATIGTLGRIVIVLPELHDDALFETEWQEVYEFVERILKRRKQWRAEQIEEVLAKFFPDIPPQGDRSPEGGDGEAGSVHESAGSPQENAPERSEP